jgi:hypothetical protein
LITFSAEHSLIFQTKHIHATSILFVFFISDLALSASMPIRDSRFWLQMPGIEYQIDKQEWDAETTTDGVKESKSYTQNSKSIDTGGSPLIGGRFDNSAVMVSASSLMYDHYLSTNLAVGGVVSIDHEVKDNQFLLSKEREKTTDSGYSVGPSLTYWFDLSDTSALYTLSVLRVHSGNTKDKLSDSSSSERTYTAKPGPSLLGGIYYLSKLSENIAVESGVSFFVRKIESTTKRIESGGSKISSEQDSTFTRFRIGLFSLIFSI